MGYARCRFSSRKHTPLQQRSHHASPSCCRELSLEVTSLRLHRQFARWCHLLLHRSTHYARARTATLPHPSSAYATCSSSGAALGYPHGILLLGPLSWRRNPCCFGYYAQQSPYHQCNDAPWPHTALRHRTNFCSRHSKILLVTNRDMLSLDIPCPRG